MSVVGACDSSKISCRRWSMSSSGPIADGFDEFLRPDDMLDGMSKLFSQLAMSDKHKSDHDITAPIA